MIAAVDVHYEGAGARAAAVGFHRWTDATPAIEEVTAIPSVESYEPGAFYKRELPCLAAILPLVSPTVVIVDAYVDLGDGKPGLGRRLYDLLGGSIPVVGVAKTHYPCASVVEVRRGTSVVPLFVTAAGMSLHAAADSIASMAGPFRIPTLLSRVDALSRGRGNPQHA